MGPRPGGRGEAEGQPPKKAGEILLQWGHGPEAVERN